MEDAGQRRFVSLARPEPGIVFMTMLNGIYDKEAKPNTRGMIPSYNTDKFDDILLRLRLSLFIFMSTFYPSYSSQIRNQNVSYKMKIVP